MTKKNKPLYDEDGRWVEERGRIKGAIRRAFRLSPQMKEVIQSARVELSPALKKDGTPGKKPRIRYTCAHCGELFSQKHIQVDHIDTVVPLWIAESEMTYDEIVRGVFCSIDNLQVLCSTPMKQNNGLPSCHKKKTDEERWVRKRLQEDLKDMKLKESVEDRVKLIKKEYEAFLIEKEEKCQKRKKKKKS